MRKRLLAMLIILLFMGSSFTISNEAGEGRIKNEKVIAKIIYKSSECFITTLQPIVIITSPEDGSVVTDPHLVVLGHATDEAGMNYWEWEWHWQGGSYSNSSYFETAEYVEFRIDIYGLHPGWNLVIVRFKNIYGAWGEDSVNVTYNPPNNPPNKPSKPEGPTEGKVKETLYFNTVTTDPDGDSLEYLIDWGDGTNTGWLGPIASGYPFQSFHAWDEPGIYEVKAKARDIPYLEESEWSDPLIVTIYENDTEPPVVVIEYPENGSVFTEPNITVIGYAEDNVGLSKIGYLHEWENGSTNLSWTLEDTPTYYSFEIPINLYLGINEITIVFFDPTGNMGKDKVRVEKKQQCKECEIKILTQNCQLIPTFLPGPGSLLMPPEKYTPLARLPRAEEIGKMVSKRGEWGKNYDIICLQEVFSWTGKNFLYKNLIATWYLFRVSNLRGKWYKLDMDKTIKLDGEKIKLLKANPPNTDIQQIAILKKGDKYVITGPDSTDIPRWTLDGGLMILTKLKVLAASGFTFSDQAGRVEEYSNKGALYARLQVDKNNPDCYIHLFTTHLASGNAIDVRKTQLEEISKFIENCIKDDKKDGKLHPIILCGDFNIVGGSREYKNRLKNLKIANKNFEDVWLKLGKKDTTKKDAATWVGKDKDVTGTPWGKKNVLARENGDFQRLDYILFFEGDKPIILKAKSIDREPNKARDKPYEWNSREGKVKSYTLSDHLGVKATFKAKSK